MATKSKYLKDKLDFGNKCFKVGRDIEMQMMADCVLVVLADSSVMGGNAFGKERLTRVFNALMDTHDHFIDALTKSDEADYLADELDRRLTQILGSIQPFAERYPYYKEFDYGKR